MTCRLLYEDVHFLLKEESKATDLFKVTTRKNKSLPCGVYPVPGRGQYMVKNPVKGKHKRKYSEKYAGKELTQCPVAYVDDPQTGAVLYNIMCQGADEDIALLYRKKAIEGLHKMAIEGLCKMLKKAEDEKAIKRLVKMLYNIMCKDADKDIALLCSKKAIDIERVRNMLKKAKNIKRLVKIEKALKAAGVEGEAEAGAS